MPEEHVELFRQRLNELCTLTEEELTEVIHIDMALPFSYVSERLVEELSLLEPFGKGNTRPLFPHFASPACMLKTGIYSDAVLPKKIYLEIAAQPTSSFDLSCVFRTYMKLIFQQHPVALSQAELQTASSLPARYTLVYF